MIDAEDAGFHFQLRPPTLDVDLECQEVRLTRDRLGVRVYSTDASLSHRSDENLYFWVDVQLRVTATRSRGPCWARRTTPSPWRLGQTTVTGLFDGTPPLDVRPRSGSALVTSAGSPVEVPEGTLAGCDLSFVAVQTS